MKKYEYKYALSSGKYIFAPTNEMKCYGKAIKKEIEFSWHCPNYYYHLLPSGHIGAIKKHIDSDWFMTADIKDFFYQINQSKITRSLNKLFHNYDKSREIAKLSTVLSVFNGRKIWHIPYGFPQSSIISSVCLKTSFLGAFLEKLEKQGYVISVYVDDIIISGKIESYNPNLKKEFLEAAKKSNLMLNPKKTHLSKSKITVFNINLTHLHTKIEKERRKEFFMKLNDTDVPDNSKIAIKKYIESAET